MARCSKIGTNGSGYSAAHEFCFQDNNGNIRRVRPAGGNGVIRRNFYGKDSIRRHQRFGWCSDETPTAREFHEYPLRRVSALRSPAPTLRRERPGYSSSARTAAAVDSVHLHRHGGKQSPGRIGRCRVMSFTGTTYSGVRGSWHIFQVNTEQPGTPFPTFTPSAGARRANPRSVLVLSNGVLYGTSRCGAAQATRNGVQDQYRPHRLWPCCIRSRYGMARWRGICVAAAISSTGRPPRWTSNAGCISSSPRGQ